MAIPVAYNVRNLVVRKTTTIMTALGIALTVAVLLAILAMVAGLRNTLETSGDPLNILVLRKGSDSELVSVVMRSQLQDMKFKEGIATGRDGQPLASLEVITIIILGSTENPEGANLTVRGLQPAGIELRPGVHISKGRWFQPGQREVVVGRSIDGRFPDAQIGRKIHFGRGDWDVVGVMDAGNGAQNSEIWGDYNQVASDLQRIEAASSALIHVKDRIAAKALIDNLNDDQRLGVHAQTEQEYFALQTRGAAPIEFIGLFVAIVMAVGSCFAAMNTMYAAVARRAKEIGTLRVLGFSRGSIMVSFFLESVMLSALGGLLGFLLVLPLNGLTTEIGNGNFAEMAFGFRVTTESLFIGLAFAIVLGGLGGLFPARNASRKEILTALREV
jgi:putative ABC transport system permease protein